MNISDREDSGPIDSTLTTDTKQSKEQLKVRLLTQKEANVNRLRSMSVVICFLDGKYIGYCITKVRGGIPRILFESLQAAVRKATV
jgi:hypothetical protein